ncbi:porin [Vibrio scophthalmi]|nr:porin [Vibrio scophthalmi]
MFGINAQLSGDNYRLNASYLNSRYDQRVTLLNVPAGIPNLMRVLESHNNSIELYSLGAEYEFGPTTLSAELQKNDRTSAWYSALQHRFDAFTPYLVYGQQYSEESDNGKRTREGESVTTGVRYDLRYNLSLNAEWQYFDTKNGGDGAFIDVPTKPNANLYTIMVNFVF